MSTAFHAKVDALFIQIEEWLEKSNTELDFESEQGILTIYLPEGSEIVLTRQVNLQEVWLASPLGAFHFKDEKAWRTHQGQLLIPLLQEIIQKKANIILDVNAFEAEQE